jgi:two-component system, LytTR family, sensor kinase
MKQKIIQFFKQEWKKLLTLFIIAIVQQLIGLSFLYTADPELANETYGKLGGLFLHSIKSVLEFMITYYLLIFQACLPLLQSRKISRFVLIVLSVFLIKFGYTAIVEFDSINYKVSGTSKDAFTTFIKNHKFLFFSLSSFFFYIVTLVISFVAAFIIDYNTRNRRQKELIKQKMDAELAAIKYQINPHFLFNSLSFIYSKTVPLSEEVSNAVLLLSDIMRYALGKEEDAEGKVALSQELTHMKNVIEINQMRFNNKLNIQYSEEINNPNARITPLVLITLVENAFKHGDLLDPANPLVVRTEASEKTITFLINNKKKKGTKELSTGIGLNNVKQRLQLMYAEKHTFTVTENEDFYTAALTINL